MERIKQALEKARLERQQSGSLMSSPSYLGPASIPGPVIYSHTRTVNVAKEFLEERRIITGVKQSTYTDAYKILRTQVLQRLREKSWNSLAITSPSANEGKTLIAINLGISLAREVNYTVLLVDADLRHPSVHDYLGIKAEYGLSDYLTDDKPLSELLVHPHEIPGFVVLPGGKPLSNSAEMLNSQKMARLVEELKERYPSRIVLFDLPPLLSTADALAFSPYVDAALLVIEDGKTQMEEGKQAVSLLKETNLIGTVLNKSWVSDKSEEGESSKKWFSRVLNRAYLFRIVWMNWFNRFRRNKS